MLIRLLSLRTVVGKLELEGQVVEGDGQQFSGLALRVCCQACPSASRPREALAVDMLVAGEKHAAWRVANLPLEFQLDFHGGQDVFEGRLQVGALAFEAAQVVLRFGEHALVLKTIML